MPEQTLAELEDEQRRLKERQEKLLAEHLQSEAQIAERIRVALEEWRQEEEKAAAEQAVAEYLAEKREMEILRQQAKKQKRQVASFSVSPGTSKAADSAKLQTKGKAKAKAPSPTPSSSVEVQECDR